MRFYPLVPLYVLVPFIAITIGLLILCVSRKKTRKKKNIRRIIMLGLVAIILARPVFLDGKARNESNNLNIYFVVDATNSMGVTDVEGSPRYVKAAKDIYDITKALLGSRYSVIIQDTASYVAVPISTSTDFVSSIWNEKNADNPAKAGKGLLTPKSIDRSKGTDFNSLLSLTYDKVHAYKKSFPARKNIVFFMSDGENTDGNTIDSLGMLRNDIDGGAVFGYGSVKGGLVLNNSSDAKSPYAKYDGKDMSVETTSDYGCDGSNCIVSKINENILKSIADRLGVKYYHREKGDIPGAVIDTIREVAQYEDEDESSSTYRDIYWIFSMILIVLLLWDFREVLDNVMREKEFKHA